MKELTHKKTYTNNAILTNIFIPTSNTWESTENNNLSVIESGKKGVLFDNIINYINNARRMICLQSFLIQDTKIIDALLVAKKDRGVKIFIMNSAEARLGNTIEEDESFPTKEYKKMLEEKFKNNFVHRQANNLHAKFILIDPKTNPKGYVFTGNFNKKPFFENPELAVELSKTQTIELFKVFVYHFWEKTTDEQTVSKQFDKVKPINKFDIPKINQILLTSPNKDLSNLKNTLLEAVSKATNEIQFSTFGFDINHELSKSILEKLKSGIKVTVFCRPREKAVIGNIDILAQHGATVYCHSLIHAKSLIIDNKEGYIFSANFENHGLNTGFEIGVKLKVKQTKDLLKIYTSWSNTFPFKYFHNSKLIAVEKFHKFKNGRISKEKNIKKEEVNSDSKIISSVGELINYFSIKEPSNFQSKKIIFERIAKLNVLQSKYHKVKELNKEIEIINFEIEKKKNKKVEGLLIDIQKVTDVSKLMSTIGADYKGYKIYAK